MNTRCLPHAVVALSVLAGLTFGAPAGASRGSVGDLLLDVPGDGLGFRNGPFDPLLLTDGLAPGDSGTAVVGVRSDGGPASDLSLRFLQIADLDPECSPAEAPVDASCGTGPGELGEDVIFDISADLDDDEDDDEFGSPVFSGTVGDLADGIPLGGSLVAGEEWFFRVTARLPLSSGNETMTDSLAFDLEWRISGDTEVLPGVTPDPEVLPAVTPDDPLTTSKLGTDTLGIELTAPNDPAAPTGGVSGLPFTGPVGVPEAIAVGVALLLVGLAVRTAGRRRAAG
jgi:hypothetical protein